MISKKIDLGFAYELLEQEPPVQSKDKKTINAEKKQIKELRELNPVKIEVKFKRPWWDIDAEDE